METRPTKQDLAACTMFADASLVTRKVAPKEISALRMDWMIVGWRGVEPARKLAVLVHIRRHSRQYRRERVGLVKHRIAVAGAVLAGNDADGDSLCDRNW